MSYRKTSHAVYALKYHIVWITKYRKPVLRGEVAKRLSELLQRLKGRSSRKLLEEFGELNRQFWGRHLWARGYFAASSGNVTDEIIKQYIESQGQEPPTEDDGFNIGEL